MQLLKLLFCTCSTLSQSVLVLPLVFVPGVLDSRSECEEAPALFTFTKSLLSLPVPLKPAGRVFPSCPLLLEPTLNFIFNLETGKSFLLISEGAVFALLLEDDPDTLLTLPGVMGLTTDECGDDFDDERLDFKVIGFPP